MNKKNVLSPIHKFFLVWFFLQAPYLTLLCSLRHFSFHAIKLQWLPMENCWVFFGCFNNLSCTLHRFKPVRVSWFVGTWFLSIPASRSKSLTSFSSWNINCWSKFPFTIFLYCLPPPNLPLADLHCPISTPMVLKNIDLKILEYDIK